MPCRSTEISVVGSMLPPETTAQTGPVPADLAGEERGDADGAGALDEQLRALEQERDRVADLVVVRRPRGRRGAGRGCPSSARPGCLTAIPSAIVWPSRRDLDADEPDVRPERAQRDRDPRGEPAAADRDQHRLERRAPARRARARSSPGPRSRARPRRRGRRWRRSPRRARAPRRARRRSPRRRARPRRRRSGSARPSPSARPAA